MKAIDRNIEMPKQYGTYNRFCPHCYAREGHSLIWCRECGKKMIKYEHEITWDSYINAATTKSIELSRIRSFMCSHHMDEWRLILNEDEKYISGLIDEGLSEREIHEVSNIFSQTYSALGRLKSKGIIPRKEQLHD